MPVSPPFTPPSTVPNYWTLTTLSFDRSLAFPDNPEFQNVFPNDIQVADFNGDGHLDVLQIYSWIPGQDLPGIPIRVLLGDGQGGFTDGTAALFGSNVPIGDGASGLSIADFNGDGRADIFIAQSGERLSGLQNRLILSNGPSGMVDVTSTNIPQISDFTHWSTAGDIDGDGDNDILVVNLGPIDNGRDIYFLLNDGTGDFTRSDSQLPSAIDDFSATTKEYTSALLFDADNDGDLDLFLGMWGPQAALTNSGATHSLVLFNDGAGHFSETAASTLPDSIYPSDRAEVLGTRAIDLNGDGSLDLLALTVNGYGETAERYVQVLINNGDGTFRDETSSRLDATQTGGAFLGRYLQLADVNDDGSTDLILQTGGTSRFYLNDGAGNFIALPPDFLFTNGGGYAFVPGDFNEDGRTDFFVRTIVNSWDDPSHVTEFDWIATWTQPPGTTLNGDGAANAVLGDDSDETLNGLGGDDIIFAAQGNDALNGGAGADYLNGGAGADTLLGGDGNDTLNGGTGADAMTGNLGDDTYYVDAAGDTVSEGNIAGGTDTVYASVTFNLAATAYADHLVLQESGGAINGTGNSLANTITGNSAANVLQGSLGDDTLNAGAGNDTLYGGDGVDTLNGEAGADTMIGNLGDDAYTVDDAGDVVLEGNIAGGVDHVSSSVTFNLGPTGYADNLTLTGSANIDGFGNILGNTITGNSGVNALWGNGGNDTLSAGDGNDSLYGGDGADSLDGGTGADTMIGNFGNDTYYVDNAGDVVSEGNIAGGTDTVFASVSFHLGPTGYADNLTLTGVSAINATGNTLANTLIGNNAANVLTGNAGNDVLAAGDGADTLYGGDGADTLDGGTGADAMIGNAGDDSYYVDNAGDTVSEGSNVGGTDHVYASVSFNLAPTGFAENLTLTGTDAINATGNNLANTLTGNAGANTLTGAGGADSFVFAAPLGAGNVDAIADFSVVVDTIVLNNSIFTGLGAGALDANAFVIAAAAADADDRIIYDSATGSLYFDADGAGGADQILFATLTAGLALTSADFIVSGP